MARQIRIQQVLHSPGGGIDAGRSGLDVGYLQYADACLGVARSHLAAHHITYHSDKPLNWGRHRSYHHDKEPLVHHTCYLNSDYRVVVQTVLLRMDHAAFHWYRTTM